MAEPKKGAVAENDLSQRILGSNLGYPREQVSNLVNN